MEQLPGATLTEFIVVVDDFEDRLKEVVAKLAENAKVQHRRRGQLADCGLDISNCALSFYRVHAEVAFWQQDDTAMVSKAFFGQPTKLPFRIQSDRTKRYLDDSARSLIVGYKSLLFFFRSFQDSAHAVMLELTGHKSGAHSTMSACLKNQKAPVHKYVIEIPGYVEWFNKMRDQRNEIKGGIGFAIVGPQWDVGVGFVEITNENAQTLRSDQLHLKDLVQSVVYSHRLLDAIAGMLSCCAH
ncbi:hypothetical protein LPN04_14040 [Rugamonas sp. A1-17]|nr:hypothetical protein [Rugamonas sp. A1-17]